MEWEYRYLMWDGMIEVKVLDLTVKQQVISVFFFKQKTACEI